jgi:hypothetical protein
MLASRFRKEHVMQVEFTFDTKRALHSTQVFNTRKGVEHLFTFALLTGSPSYANDQAVWLSWLTIGFDTSLVDSPPGIAKTDRVRIETQPEARTIAIRAESSVVDALKALETLLVRVDSLRSSFQKQDGAQRAAVLVADAEVDRLLMAPLKSALQRHSFRPDETARLITTAQDSLAWVTDNDITGMSVATTVA